jgi:hypothetical protein
MQRTNVPPDDPTRHEPGAGALREYERRREARLRRSADVLPGEAPAHEEAWRKGAAGERLVGRRLNAEARAVGGVAVLHDLTLPGRRANIDHLVIGPAGVAVVDAKAWGGRVWLGRDAIWQGRHARRDALEGMRHQLHRVHATLAAVGWDHVPVLPVICLVNGVRGPARDAVRLVDGIGVGSPEAVARFVTRAGPLTYDDVHRLLALLGARFAVRGGAVAPTSPRRRAPLASPVVLPPEATLAAPKAKLRRWRRRRPRIVGRTVALLTLQIAAALAFVAIGASVLIAALDTGGAVSPPVSRSELAARGAELRHLAASAARGRVRGPRIRASRTAFVLTYHRGPRCRVDVTVLRARSLAALPALTRAHHCRR